jgi:EAL domain-containing protein (putative c-di-GMP-specific phosphodiesterase class I)
VVFGGGSARCSGACGQCRRARQGEWTILRRWNVEPSAVELELTESVLMETTREHRDIIDRLRALGVSIAIDDFGTGYSSLGYLRAYRVGHIKIAQEFIKNLREDSGDIAIVRAAISLGRELGIRVIAEGVETAYQLNLLAAAGCKLIQGFYFSPPVPASAMAQLLRQGRLQGGQPAPATNIDPPALPTRKGGST